MSKCTFCKHVFEDVGFTVLRNHVDSLWFRIASWPYIVSSKRFAIPCTMISRPYENKCLLSGSFLRGVVKLSSGWWFGTFFLFHILGIKTSTDELHHFSEG